MGHRPTLALSRSSWTLHRAHPSSLPILPSSALSPTFLAMTELAREGKPCWSVPNKVSGCLWGLLGYFISYLYLHDIRGFFHREKVQQRMTLSIYILEEVTHWIPRIQVWRAEGGGWVAHNILLPQLSMSEIRWIQSLPDYAQEKVLGG